MEQYLNNMQICDWMSGTMKTKKTKSKFIKLED